MSKSELNSLKQARNLGFNTDVFKDSIDSNGSVDQIVSNAKNKFLASFNKFTANLKQQTNKYNKIVAPNNINSMSSEDKNTFAQDMNNIAESLITLSQESGILREKLRVEFNLGTNGAPDLDDLKEAQDKASYLKKRQEIAQQLMRDNERRFKMLELTRQLLDEANEINMQTNLAIKEEIMQGFEAGAQEEARLAMQNGVNFKPYQQNFIMGLVEANLSSPRYDPASRCGMMLAALFTPNEGLLADPKSILNRMNAEDLDKPMRNYHKHLGDVYPNPNKNKLREQLANIPNIGAKVQQ